MVIKLKQFKSRDTYSTATLFQNPLETHTLFKLVIPHRHKFGYGHILNTYLGPMLSMGNSIKHKNNTTLVLVKCIIWKIPFLQKASTVIVKTEGKEFDRL